jgi:RNA polymerase sigma factor (sigma-70 family)
LEVMSMDRKLWTEAQGIAARHGRGDGEDLAQDLAVAALEADGVVKAGAWMERVGRNAAIDRWRRDTRRAELAKEIELPAVPDPETVLLARERREVVRRAVAALPRLQRRAAIARFHGELPFEDVAQRIGTEPVTARTRVHRALVALRRRLDGLRAMLAIPGVQASALGLALVAVELPLPATAVAIAGADSGSGSVARHRPPARVMAAAPAPAAKPSADRSPAPPKREVTEVPAVQKYDFEEDEVLGDLHRPDWIPVTVGVAARHSSLIELREHFIPEMLKGLEDL